MKMFIVQLLLLAQLASSQVSNVYYRTYSSCSTAAITTEVTTSGACFSGSGVSPTTYDILITCSSSPFWTASYFPSRSACEGASSFTLSGNSTICSLQTTNDGTLPMSFDCGYNTSAPSINPTNAPFTSTSFPTFSPGSTYTPSWAPTAIPGVVYAQVKSTVKCSSTNSGTQSYAFANNSCASAESFYIQSLTSPFTYTSGYYQYKIVCNYQATASPWTLTLYNPTSSCSTVVGTASSSGGGGCVNVNVTTTSESTVTTTIHPITVDCGYLQPSIAPTFSPTGSAITVSVSQTCTSNALGVYSQATNACQANLVFATSGINGTVGFVVNCDSYTSTSAWTLLMYGQPTCQGTFATFTASGSSCQLLYNPNFQVTLPVAIDCAGYGIPSLTPTVSPVVSDPTFAPVSVSNAPSSVASSRQPTIQPTQPTSQPSSRPSYSIYSYTAPRFTSLATTASRTTITVTGTLDLSSKYAGIIYCAALTNATNLTSTSMVVTSGKSLGYVSNTRTFSLAITGLTPVTVYNVYCYVATTSGFVNSLATVRSTKTISTTQCCKTLTFTSRPSYVNSDSSTYTTATAATVYTFTYALQSLPSNTLTVTPTLFYANGSSIKSSILRVNPSSATFRSTSSSLTSSFTLQVTFLTMFSAAVAQFSIVLFRLEV